MADIAVIGTGYVGLTTGAYLAHVGHRVVCADIVASKVERLNRGEIPIFEPGLDELVREGLDGGRLSFVVGSAPAAAEAEFIFLCVQTPQGDDGSADLSYIEAAAREIAPVLQSQSIVINKSTVPVGSTIVVERALGRSDVSVVSNPEFLREGSAVHDCLHPDRIVIGSEDHAAAIRVAELYEAIKAPLLITDPSSAETIKYASNAFLATKISYVNAIANVCEAVGADVREVVLGMGYDKRIGFEFLKPGPGWGGSCFDGAETLVARRSSGRPMLLRFDELFAQIDADGRDARTDGVDGWEVLAWSPGAPSPAFEPLSAATVRPHRGDGVQITTKMGRRLLVTADHPFVVGDGTGEDGLAVLRADQLTTDSWLPVAQQHPLWEPGPRLVHPLDSLAAAGLTAEQVICRLGPQALGLLASRIDRLPAVRRRDVRRTGACRLHEAQAMGLAFDASVAVGTTTNGTYVPSAMAANVRFWRVVGLWLAEGAHVIDTSAGGYERHRLTWSFHPTDEEHLVQEVASFWRDLGVRVDVRQGTTSRFVSISSRILAAWFTDPSGLGLGRGAYDKRIPHQIWDAGEAEKRALLSGAWEGDGSWSLLNGGPSVVLEYGTVSPLLADGLLRLLGELGVVARTKRGRSAKSTVDAHFLCISGADQVEDALWLFADEEADGIRQHVAQQSKRIAPTGYRRYSKGTAWVRVVRAERVPMDGPVYSVEVAPSHTVVTTGGLVAHNCFPKDTRALVKIAEDAGYDFGLLKGVIDVNEEQFERVVAKVERALGGSVSGKVVAAWGLTFKARTDDRRDSPALEIIRRLTARGAKVQAYDPTVTQPLDGMEVCTDPYGACADADVLVVLTEWDEFRWNDFAKVSEAMANPVIVDTRNLLDPATARRRGFTYVGLGRG